MPREPRLYSLVEDGLFHIIARGNNKKVIFTDEEDYLFWKKLLIRYKQIYDVKVIAYCQMPNHFHLLIKSGETLSKFMGVFNTQYAKYFNKKLNTSGHLFGGRFKSYLVTNDPYLFTLIRYIHANPVRANIVIDSLEYKHSSIYDYQNNDSNNIIDQDILYQYIDRSTKGTPIARFIS